MRSTSPRSRACSPAFTMGRSRCVRCPPSEPLRSRHRCSSASSWIGCTQTMPLAPSRAPRSSRSTAPCSTRSSATKPRTPRHCKCWTWCLRADAARRRAHERALRTSCRSSSTGPATSRLAEIAERIAPATEGRRGDPLTELLEQRRLVALELPTSDGPAVRVTLVETLPRYVSAFGEAILATLRVGAALETAPLESAIPEQFRHAVLSERAARGEILARFVPLAGVMSVADVRTRYDLDAIWVEAAWTLGRAMESWFAARSVSPMESPAGARDGSSSRRATASSPGRDGRSRRSMSRATRGFVERWQHVDPTTRLGRGRWQCDRHSTNCWELRGRRLDWWERDGIACARSGAHRATRIARAMANGELSVGGATRRTIPQPRTLDRSSCFAEELVVLVAPTAPRSIPRTADAVRSRRVRCALRRARRHVLRRGFLGDATSLGGSPAPRCPSGARGRRARHERLARRAPCSGSVEADAGRVPQSAGRSHAMDPGIRRRRGPSRGPASAECSSTSEMAPPRRRRRRSRPMARALVARACTRSPGSRARRERVGRGDRAAMAGSLWHRLARMVAARSAPDLVARDLSRAAQIGNARRREARVFRTRTVRGTVRTPRSRRPTAGIVRRRRACHRAQRKRSGESISARSARRAAGFVRACTRTRRPGGERRGSRHPRRRVSRSDDTNPPRNRRRRRDAGRSRRRRGSLDARLTTQGCGGRNDRRTPRRRRSSTTIGIRRRWLSPHHQSVAVHGHARSTRLTRRQSLHGDLRREAFLVAEDRRDGQRAVAPNELAPQRCGSGAEPSVSIRSHRSA